MSSRRCTDRPKRADHQPGCARILEFLESCAIRSSFTVCDLLQGFYIGRAFLRNAALAVVMAAQVDTVWPATGAEPKAPASVVSPHLPLGPDQYHRARSGPLRHRLVARALEADRRSRASSSTPAASSPTTRASSRCTTAPSPSATATSTASSPGPRTRTAWPSSRAWTRNRAHEDFFRAHPDWFARDAAGKPYRAGEKYVTCINSPYYDEYIPGVLTRDHRALASRGLHRQQLERARPRQHLLLRQLRAQVPRQPRQGAAARRDWDDAVYRAWIEWNYERRARSLGPEQPRHARPRAARIASGSA